MEIFKESSKFISINSKENQGLKENREIKNNNVEILKEIKPIDKEDIKNKEELVQLIKTINDNVLIKKNDLKFSLDTDTNIWTVKVVEEKSNKLIAQYPSEEFVKNVKFFNENIIKLFEKLA